MLENMRSGSVGECMRLSIVFKSELLLTPADVSLPFVALKQNSKRAYVFWRMHEA